MLLAAIGTKTWLQNACGASDRVEQEIPTVSNTWAKTRMLCHATEGACLTGNSIAHQTCSHGNPACRQPPNFPRW